MLALFDFINDDYLDKIIIDLEKMDGEAATYLKEQKQARFKWAQAELEQEFDKMVNFQACS